MAALALYKKAEQYAPASRALLTVSEGVATRPIQLDSSPSGATLYISDYTAALGDDLSQWKRLGTTPLTVTELPGWGYYRLRAVKPGYATTDAVLGGQNAMSIEMPTADQAADNKVWIPPMAPSAALALPGYWLSRYEVTNGQFKRFTDAGGYRRRRGLEGADCQGRPHAVVGGSRRRVPGQDRPAGAVDMGTKRLPGWSGEPPRQRRELVRGGSVRGVRGREPPDDPTNGIGPPAFR